MASVAETDALLFLNSDTMAITSDWVERLLGASDHEIVGAALVYPGTDRLQHAGVEVVPAGGRFRPNAYRPPKQYRHEFTLALQNLGVGKRLDVSARRRAPVFAVTGAFLYTSRALFNALQGFDVSYRADLQDIDYCLRGRAAGMEVICRRDIVFAHKHAASRGRYPFPLDDWRLFFGRWAEELERWKGVGSGAHGSLGSV